MSLSFRAAAAPLLIAGWALRARRWFALGNGDGLDAHQEHLLGRLRRRVLTRSPFYRELADCRLEDMPVMNRSTWMAEFDRINTAGVRLDQALAQARRAEQDRDFSPTLHGLTVGLSTGTSGRRGVFLLSQAEQERWAGVILACLLRGNPLRQRRIAFFLRADSRLYRSVGRGPLAMRYFDMLRPWTELMEDLLEWHPDILVAPASALTMIARDCRIAPEQIVSIAEVLDTDDRHRIRTAFGVEPLEIYQATEGLVALPCRLGRLHLNEAFMRVETEWIDRQSGRFAPIVTDLTRSTQPVIRYRLDDILVMGEACTCGMAGRTISRIEGRCDDVCHLLKDDGRAIPVFPDYLVRAMLEAEPDGPPFVIVQHRAGCLEVQLDDAANVARNRRIEQALQSLARRMGAQPADVAFRQGIEPQRKRRRVVRRTPINLPSEP